MTVRRRATALVAVLLLLTSACADQPTECTVLDVSLHGQEDVYNGTIRMRLAPQGVDPTIAAASQGGKLLSRSTRAEDLAQPIADTQRRLALLTTHRDRLAEFMKSKDIEVEQLIAVSKELAKVQTEIDSIGTEQAHRLFRDFARRQGSRDDLPQPLGIGVHLVIASRDIGRCAARALSVLHANLLGYGWSTVVQVAGRSAANAL